MTTTTENQSTTIHLNPSVWNQGFRFDQAQLRPAPTQVVNIAGQCPIDREGTLLHAGDMAGQIGAAMDNLTGLLGDVGMDLGDVLRMTVYVTDMEAALAAYGEVTSRLDAVSATPPCTLVGVNTLAVPGMQVEIEASAGR